MRTWPAWQDVLIIGEDARNHVPVARRQRPAAHGPAVDPEGVAPMLLEERMQLVERADGLEHPCRLADDGQAGLLCEQKTVGRESLLDRRAWRPPKASGFAHVHTCTGAPLHTLIPGRGHRVGPAAVRGLCSCCAGTDQTKRGPLWAAFHGVHMWRRSAQAASAIRPRVAWALSILQRHAHRLIQPVYGRAQRKRLCEV